MGRPRKNFGKGTIKSLACKCGKKHMVAEETTEVTCDLCLLKMKPVDCSKDVDKLILARTKAATIEEASKGKRGRPRKIEVTNESTNSLMNDLKSDEEELMDCIEVIDESEEKRGRGRPRKSQPLSTDKKGKKMTKESVVKNMEPKGGSGKRGRKATVGAAVLSFIKSKGGDVPFTDILGVYSSEREKMGKKGTPEIETRNCYSTLYVMCHGKATLVEVAKKQTYRAV